MRAATVLRRMEPPAAKTKPAIFEEAEKNSEVASQGHAAYSPVFVARAAVVAASTFVCAVAGILAQELLTAPALAGSRSMTGSVVGLVGALLSVVVGLLVWQSYGLFIGQQSDLDALGRALARMRYVLGSFGGEAAPALAVLGKQILRVRARLWPDPERGPRNFVYDHVHQDVHAMLAALDKLRPANHEQQQSLAQAREIFGRFIETQTSMIRSLSNRVPNLLLNVVMGWACALFFGYGLLAGLNAMTLFMAAVGSAAIASAIFLILEMSDPYSGLFRISSASLDQFLHGLTATD
jgi:hypothetical protein